MKLWLTLASSFNWTVTCADISTAFLHALITGEEILVIPPLEYYPEGKTLWKLKRALYGLRNAPRLWQDRFASVMERNNFQRMKSEPDLYVRKTKRLYVLAYVDDLMFFGCKPDVDDLISILRKELILKVTGELTEGSQVTFLGGNIRRTGDFIEFERLSRMLSVKELDLLNAKPALTPGTDTLKTKGVSEPVSKDEHKRYRRLVGQLLWLCKVRCDIMFAVKEL